MTKLSFDQLSIFVNNYRDKIMLPIADYGGTNIWGFEDVKNLFASGGITDYNVLDLETGYDLLKPIPGRKYGLGICMDLLEHTTNPFLVAKNIYLSLKKDALLFVTVPWIWEVHKYPGDYWRFTVDGVIQLFPKMKVLEAGFLRDEHRDANDFPEPLPRERVIVIFIK